MKFCNVLSSKKEDRNEEKQHFERVLFYISGIRISGGFMLL